MADERKKTPPALARARQLAERVGTDLRLTLDATRGAGLPYSAVAKVQRAQREMRDLLREIEELRSVVKLPADNKARV